MTLQLLTANRRGISRIESLGGREYKVLPVRMIRQGVLTANKGPLLYVKREIAKTTSAWNNIPIVIDHPKQGDRFVSARSPGVLDRSGIGWVFNARMTEADLDAEAWIDMDRLYRLDPELHDRINREEPVEVSTGLGTEEVPQRGTHKGKPYTHLAVNLAPDHLAVLPKDTGACSLRDGCGLAVNQADELSFVANNCGIGAGGFQPGNSCGKGGGGGFSEGVRADKTVGGLDSIQTKTNKPIPSSDVTKVIGQLKKGDTVSVVFTDTVGSGENQRGKTMTGKVTGFGKIKGTDVRAAKINATEGDFKGDRILNPQSSIHNLTWGKEATANQVDNELASWVRRYEESGSPEPFSLWQDALLTANCGSDCGCKKCELEFEEDMNFTPTSELPGFQPTSNADDGGWRTMPGGAKVYISADGEVRAGGPKGKVLEGGTDGTKVKDTVSNYHSAVSQYEQLRQHKAPSEEIQSAKQKIKQAASEVQKLAANDRQLTRTMRILSSVGVDILNTDSLHDLSVQQTKDAVSLKTENFHKTIRDEDFQEDWGVSRQDFLSMYAQIKG